MGNRDTRIGGGTVGTEVYAVVNDLQRTVNNALLNQGGESSILIDLPTVDSSFTPIYEVEGADIYVTLKYFIPGFTQELTVVIVDSTQIVDADSYDGKRKKDVIDDINDGDRQAQEIEKRFDKPLRPERLHHVILLKAWDENGNAHTNPEDGTDYTGYPGNVLFSFTTPAAMTNPLNKPHIGNIIENNLDDSTSRQFDAWVSVQMIAPSSASNVMASTVTVTLNSTSVNGTGFTAGISVGNAIEVNGETHIVTNVNSNILLTVDYPFKQATAAGQTATRKVLHTFNSAGIIAVAPKFRATTDSEVKALAPHTPIDETLGALTNLKVKVPGFYAAKTYNYVNNLAIGEGNARVSSTPSTAQAFTAGNFTTPTANIPEWTTAPFFQYDATDPQNDNRRDVSLRITQTSPPVPIDKIQLYRRNAGTGTISGSTTTITGSGTAFLTDLAPGHFIIAAGQTLEVASRSTNTSLILVTAPSPALSGGTTWVKSVLKDDFSLQIGKFHPSAGGLVPPIKFGEIKTNKLTAFDFVAVITALNSVTRTITDSFTTGSAGDGVQPDTAVPTLSTNPDTGTTGPTVQERHSKIDVFCPLPSANINTLDNYQVILSTSSTHPAGDPTVGANGVLVIKYGQNPTFNLSYFADFGDQFYVLFRAHNSSVGYSVWSASTNQDGYSRPIQDFIGTAVPSLAEGLVRAGSGTGVSTTVFQLDAAASAVDDFYVGNALNLLSPGTSSPAQDTWRTIIDYVGSTKRVTLDTALSSTPGGGISFVVDAIGVTGDRATKSSTGHTTTTFVLDSGASAADDFYLGYTLYIGSMATASDRIRKVVDYVGSTRTLTVDIAFGTSPSGNLAYLLVNGSVGFGSPSLAESLTEPAYPVPFRWYLNDKDNTVFEVLPPTGENAFSLTHFQITSRRRNAGAALRDDSGAVAVSSGTGYTSPGAPSGVFWAAAIRFRNMYRTSGSDGWSALSAYVALLNIDGSPNYDPDKTGGTKLIDYQGEDSYPVSRYPDNN